MRYFKAKISQLLPILLVVGLVAGGFWLATAGPFKISQITCQTQYGPCSADEEGKLAPFLGEQLFLFNSGQVRQTFSADFKIKHVFVDKIFPQRLAVFLEKRKAQVALASAALPGRALIDQDGIVLELVPSSPLPAILVGPQTPLVLGERVGEETRFAAQLLILIWGLHSPQEIGGRQETGKFVVQLKETEAIFPLSGEPRVLVGALQLILTRSKIEGRLPKTIDLRYSNPVLTY